MISKIAYQFIHHVLFRLEIVISSLNVKAQSPLKVKLSLLSFVLTNRKASSPLIVSIPVVNGSIIRQNPDNSRKQNAINLFI